ncbi:MAG TPA: hypothetical protein VGI64_04955 [Streptosporangiaceae bacterium]|jgi:hypothetical protein
MLDKIEYALCESDPGLTSRFHLFSRLAAGEEMPRVEQLRARAGWLMLRLAYRAGTLARRLRLPRLGRYRQLLFIPLAIVILASTFVVAAALPGPKRCRATTAAATASPAAGRAPRCLPPPGRPLFIGR